ncbi:hypothetical protein D0868_10327 [Hortaea werneckii]|uniref:CBM20 domain-containing protein n=1 Tax=Hortaea werneckii TaxID=91943 RepID=A0A3M6Y4R3_HORWE|nr:hypothetical protein D0868_10327 [Hortaea werneckii]
MNLTTFYVLVLLPCFVLTDVTLFNGAQDVVFEDAPAGCLAAFDQPLVCDDKVQLLGYDIDSLEFSETALDALCSKECGRSLLALRQLVSSACSEYDIPFNGAYISAVDVVDLFEYKFNMSCLADTRGEFCLIVEQHWDVDSLDLNGQATWPAYTEKIYLDFSDGNYDGSPAEDVDGTLLDLSDDPITWPEWLSQLQLDDSGEDYFLEPISPDWRGHGHDATTVYDLAINYKAPSAALLHLNAVRANHIESGSYCAPLPCEVTMITSRTGAENLIQSFGNITVTQFWAWNDYMDPKNLRPGLDDECGNLLAGFAYCVAPVDGKSINPLPTTSRTSMVTPSPTQDGLSESCNEFYFVKSGDGCYNIAKSYGISLKDFYAYNPSVLGDCLKLLANFYVCVGVTEVCSIDVTFKTIYSTGWGESISVVGSLPELGGWDAIKGKSLTATSSADGSIHWEGTVRLPADTEVSYKFVKTGIDGTLSWEQDPNRVTRTSSCNGPTIERGGSWHSGDSASCSTVFVTFEVTARTSYGESLFVIGSVPNLGEWNTENVIPLSAEEYTEADPVWKTAIAFGLGETAQYKYLKIGLDGVLQWESDPNRQILVPQDCGTAAVQRGVFQQ